MNKFLTLFILAFLAPVTLFSQNEIDSVISQVERNNTTLAALRKSAEAEKIGNKRGIYLQNPEVGFNYLWSGPLYIGNRTDINVVQSFDFPTAYGHRKHISDYRNTQADLEYRQQRKEILLEAHLLCVEIVYANALIQEYQGRLSYARDLAQAYQAMYDLGEIGMLENNKAHLNLLNIKKEMDEIELQQATALKHLAVMNGGRPIDLNSPAMPLSLLPSDFDQWYNQAEQSSPELLWLSREIEVSRQEAKLEKALSLPKASAGYMSEKYSSEHFQGLTVGVSIPLWENKNTVKYAEARTEALNDELTDYKHQFYHHLRIQFEKASSLQKTVEEYRQYLDLYRNEDLLKTQFEKGEISLLNYLMELSFAYQSIDKYLSAEYDYNKAVAILNQYQL